MLFPREVEPREEGVRVSVSEELVTTPVNLFKIGFFAGLAFLGMAAVSEDRLRGAPLVVGGLILALLALGGVFLLWQRRYGEATLKAKSELVFGKPFAGWIETELESPPSGPVRVIFQGQRGKHVLLTVREDIPEERARKDDLGRLCIHFVLPVPHFERADEVEWRIYARARTWPVGWGATFRLAE